MVPSLKNVQYFKYFIHVKEKLRPYLQRTHLPFVGQVSYLETLIMVFYWAIPGIQDKLVWLNNHSNFRAFEEMEHSSASHLK